MVSSFVSSSKVSRLSSIIVSYSSSRSFDEALGGAIDFMNSWISLRYSVAIVCSASVGPSLMLDILLSPIYSSLREDLRVCLSVLRNKFLNLTAS